MPKKKITIDEALQALEGYGLQVQVEGIKQPESVRPVKKHIDIFKTKEQSKVLKESDRNIKITLFAKHSIGSGGVLNAKDQIEHAGVVTYGPGVCTVPVSIAQHLLYQDAKAKEADERMLEKVQRSYLVVERSTRDGVRANVAIPVDNAVLDNMGSISQNDMLIVR